MIAPIPRKPSSGGPRTPMDSICAKRREVPLTWAQFDHQGRSVERDLEALEGAVMSTTAYEEALARIADRLERASRGELTPNRPPRLAPEEPTVRPVGRDPAHWELRFDLRRFGAGHWRIYHSERWVGEACLVALHAHEKCLIDSPEASINDRQNDAIKVAVDREGIIRRRSLLDTTTHFDV